MSLINLALNVSGRLLESTFSSPLTLTVEFHWQEPRNLSSLLFVNHGNHSYILFLVKFLECRVVPFYSLSFVLPPKILPSCLSCLCGFLVSSEIPVYCHLITSRNIYEDLGSLKTLLFMFEVGSIYIHFNIGGGQ